MTITEQIIAFAKEDAREEGKKEGKKMATAERNAAFTKYLLQNTPHSPEEIAQLVGVSKKFVLDTQKNLSGVGK